MKRFLLTVAAAVLLCGMSTAQADVAYTMDNTTGPGVGNGPYTLGSEFQVNSTISVTGLGIFDDSQNGLVDSYPVGIFDNLGNLLVTTTVSSGTVDPLINQFRYESVSPTVLTPGIYTIGALYSDSNDGLLGPAFESVTNFQTSPSITFLADAYAFGGSLQAPGAYLTDPGYFGPNFTFTNSAVPLPGSLVLLCTGLATVGGFGWIKKRKTKVVAA